MQQYIALPKTQKNYNEIPKITSEHYQTARFYANKLSLNVQKTNFVVFAPKNTNNNMTSITLGNQWILRVNNAQFLYVFT